MEPIRSYSLVNNCLISGVLRSPGFSDDWMKAAVASYADVLAFTDNDFILKLICSEIVPSEIPQGNKT